MSNWSKSIIWPVIAIYLLLFLILYVIPVWFGNVYGENYRYELIVAIIIGVPLIYLILQEKVAKNQFRKASENYDFETNGKRDHENKVEGQKAVFRFIHKNNIRSDMGKIEERYFHLKEYKQAKTDLDNAREKLSNIELFISLLKVLALIVGALHFIHSVRANQIGKIQNLINKKVEKTEFNKLQNSVKLNKHEISSTKDNITNITNQLDNKIELNHLKNMRDSIRLNHIKSTNIKQSLRPVIIKVEQLEKLVNILDSLENTTENK